MKFSLPSTTKIVTFLGAAAGLAIVVLTTFSVVHWNTEQTLDVTLAATASTAVIGSAIGHFRKGTSPEPVALAVSLPLFVSSMLVVGNVFGWWTPPLTAAQMGTVVLGVGGLFGGALAKQARDTVTPVAPHVTAPKDVLPPPPPPPVA